MLSKFNEELKFNIKRGKQMYIKNYRTLIQEEKDLDVVDFHYPSRRGGSS
jgi:hypothetical protein